MQDLLFKVTDENLLKFNNKRELCVIQVQDSSSGRTKFGVEVTTNKYGFGRRYTPSKEVSKEIFEYLSKRISKFKNYDSAVEFIQRIFTTRRMFHLMFLARTEGKKVSQINIGELRYSMGFDIIPKDNYAGAKRKRNWITLQVMINNQKIGSFIGKRFSDDFRFSISRTAIQ